MKPLKKLTANLSVTGEVAPYDVGTLASQGFKVLINNRPDREAPDQPTSAQIAAEAKLHNMAYLHIPVVSGQMTQESIAAFGEVLETLPGPVVAFCRSGTRCTTLWALSQAGKMPVDDILKTAAAAGYDLSEMRGELQKHKAA